MSENNEAQKEFKSSYDKLKAVNEELTNKVNSLLEIITSERAEREKAIRDDLIAKINALCPTYEVGDDVKSDELALLLKGMESMPKENAEEKGDRPRGIKMDPEVSEPKLNGVEIPDDLKPYKARYESLPKDMVVTE